MRQKRLQRRWGADLYEICPTKVYTDADLDWTDKKSRSTAEMNDPACRPEIAGTVENIEQYAYGFQSFPPSGGMWNRESWIPSWKAMISPARH